jgi:N-acetylglucosaminyldiphosphoundecaprenol N-acetyl-beta-D-mannosaminyltransferase
MGGLIMQAIKRKQPFGLRLSADSAKQITSTAILDQRSSDQGVALVVTPNIDHIATIRRSSALARAYENAERIVCDGWPVQLYARLCGLRLGRVTGCEITSHLMRMAPYPIWQRLFFVVDSVVTADAVTAWAQRHGQPEMCAVTVPPFGFEKDSEYCNGLARTIAAHGTTVLIMAVGAPRSEIFVDTHRHLLPSCWAFCVGQAVKVELGLVQRAPQQWRSAGMEWLWRMVQEPARLTRRYVAASVGFSLAVIEDRFRT